MSAENFRRSVKQARQIADTLPKLTMAIKSMKQCGLTERAIIVLAADAAGVSKVLTGRVIEALDKMEELYVYKKQ